ncbi:hypothetical protein [Halomonas sp. 707B3]|jgi:hypothetical protein|uniref:hypothetical protein n=1 Tax=Halomonas sp. 707B3 TaxID=1681043 RepID=UPI000C0AB1C6|nr:hypothetical protein [Halomonas sp. 707B3]MAG54584.1 hypothetical protein [Halomonas sp.]MAN58556.1 hypothetical protein [Flavobacteriaceae bacterium]MCP1318522.1 hypothetical protein [Halomonas sp. 707B3]|tara:strand:+ start:7184 stop:7756 length:573 start_codon:yes stop_codon:yes gene_type:complete
MLTHRFNVPRHAIESTRRELNSDRFCESLRLRETLGYLENDRRTITESPPALLLTRLEVDSNGAAVATLETLATDEGRIVRALVAGLDVDQYRFTLIRGQYGHLLGLDFELTSLATRQTVRRALSRAFDDAADIAAVLVHEPRDPVELPVRQRQPEMIAPQVIQRAHAMERQQVAEKTRRNVKPLGFTFD